MEFGEAIKAVTAAVNADLAALAKREHAKVMNTDPRPVGFVRWVDGNEGAAEESVRPDGVIVYEYNRYDLVAQFILDTLRERSPVKSGEYVRSHTLFLNGVEVQDLSGWKQGDEISITNYVPYSRKIEVGKMKMSVPGHVYERTAQIARRLYREVADISFTYRGIIAGAQVNPLKAAKSVVTKTIVRDDKHRFAKGTRTQKISGGEHNKASIRFPTITLNPPGSFNSRVGL